MKNILKKKQYFIKLKKEKKMNKSVLTIALATTLTLGAVSTVSAAPKADKFEIFVVQGDSYKDMLKATIRNNKKSILLGYAWRDTKELIRQAKLLSVSPCIPK